MLFGIQPGDFSRLGDRFLKIIFILIEVALSLLICDSLSAIPVSSLVDTPFKVMLLGYLQWVRFRFVNLGKSLQIRVSINVALGLFIGKGFVTSLVSLLD